MDAGLNAYAKSLATATVERPSNADKIATLRCAIQNAERMITRSRPRERRILEQNVRAFKSAIIDLE